MPNRGDISECAEGDGISVANTLSRDFREPFFSPSTDDLTFCKAAVSKLSALSRAEILCQPVQTALLDGSEAVT